MTFSPLWSALPPIPLHAVAAMTAFVLGCVQMALRKGTALHVWLGRIWVALMAVVAGSSFFIHDLRLWGPFSPLHLLSVITLAGLGYAVVMARRGEIERHRRTMQYLFCLALVLTGAFTLLPGRVMHQVIFGS
ncbi:DUF2306 domain-containing protein [Chachezhania antarctica]|uniref:DUF2306 domain-containing protein n=1 Tax=Chachezhania antarctica TaxID=2340860 RepID=UPI000EB508E9|nr:DUF2306 domain-containing protein [Chachezhania antarctica]